MNDRLTSITQQVQPHIHVSAADVTPFALLPGDPARVRAIASHLEDPQELSFNREYLVVNGNYKGTPVTVMSTGMGGGSVAIGVEELVRCGVRYAIRVGSAGALTSSLVNGDLVVATGAVRDEGTTLAYAPVGMPAIPHPEVYQALVKAASDLGVSCVSGLVRSHDSFYRDDEDEVSAFWHKRGVLASEMESAALFIVGALRGLRTGALLNIVVEYGEDTEQGIRALADAEARRKEGEQKEIRVGLEALHLLHRAEHI